MIYICSPLASPFQSEMDIRTSKVTGYALTLMNRGIPCYSAVSYGVPFKKLGFDLGWEDYWRLHDLQILSHCNLVHVLMLSGWNTSKGIQEEIALAQQLGIRIEYIRPPDEEVYIETQDNA